MRKLTFALLTIAAFAGPVSAEIVTSVEPDALPEAKQTGLGLYLTPDDAFRALEADPSILFIDARDPVEINFVGIPVAVDAIVPLEFATRDFDPEKGMYRMEDNPDFVAQVLAIVAREGLTSGDPVLVMCRSGSRSAAAANLLAEAGFTNVWNIVEGFEGDKGEEGARDVNGWRNADLPWTYTISATQAWIAP
jgi:rhodanese-related sulfurtransferase